MFVTALKDGAAEKLYIRKADSTKGLSRHWFVLHTHRLHQLP